MINNRDLKIDPEMAEALTGELNRQEEEINLIASENYASAEVLAAAGSVFTNKYAEGYPGRRFYRGCRWMDRVEELAVDRAGKLFGADHANVQPHSGSQANMAVYFSLLKPGDTILTMNLDHGGHLSHGHRVNFSGQLYNVVSYGVDPETGLIEYDRAAELARRHRPRLVVAGASAYPRLIDFARFRRIADGAGARLLADVAHIAGPIAAGLHPDPVPEADYVTFTTHKTLRGPRGGVVLCREEFRRAVDRAVFPGIQGGPLMQQIAAKAVAFGEALRPEFRLYQELVIGDCRALAEVLLGEGFRLVSGGSDNHLLLVDLRGRGIDGRQAEEALERAGICCNRNLIPFDPLPPNRTSGLRLGTAAAATRGMGEGEMEKIGRWIAEVLARPDHGPTLARVRSESRELARRFPVYPAG